MKQRTIVRSLVGIFIATIATAGCSQTHHSDDPHAHTPHDDHASHERPTHRFDDAEAWAQKFENPDRDAWQQPAHVLEVLDLVPDAKVADIGGATGYFPVRFARAVPKGMVYSLDVEPNMVEYLRGRAAREGLSNLRGVVCAQDDPKIPEPVDVIFICNTYHHITDRVAYFARLKKSLRPGGRLVIVDFYKKKLPVGPPPRHKLTASNVQEELKAAGYALVESDSVLPYQYFMIFTPANGDPTATADSTWRCRESK